MFSAAPQEMEPSTLLMEQTCRRFTLDEIQSATQNFDEEFVVGHGGFGKVYKGQIDGSSNFVAIKRSSSTSNQGAPEFRAEVEMLSKLRHCNLVSLIGYCNEGSEMILVYDYMSRGTLGDHLRKEGAPISWLQRLKICVGAARGLDYLHTGTGTQQGIIHRDVKTSNILLDENFAAKISDFGLAKVGPTNQTVTYVSTGVKGTFGYLDPSYVYTGQLTRKSDVYSFGVVLLEVICGRPAVDTRLDEAQWGLVPWAQEKIKQGKINQFIDSRLRGQISSKCLKDFVGIASRCLHNLTDRRPTMADVISKLQAILSLQERLDSSSVTEGKFMDRVIFFFSSKVESGSEGEPSNKADNSKDTYDQVRASPQPPMVRTEGILKVFSFNDLRLATRNFRADIIVGEGSHSIVYKGWIHEPSLGAAKPDTGTLVAVKRITEIHDPSNWLAEISNLGQLNHPNFVKLIGYCLEDDQRLLVYEFMPRGSLEKRLFRRGSDSEPFPWNLRIKAILDAAKGLAYIHNQKLNVMWNGFDSSSILFDSNHNARISNFWLMGETQVTEQYIPTSLLPSARRGYDAPEFIYTGLITRKSQIYGFGIVLLELLTGRRCIENNRPYNERNLITFAKPYLTDKRRMQKIIDPNIHGQYSPAVAMRAAKLAMECLIINPSERPTADEIVRELEELQDLQKMTETKRGE